MTESLTAQGLTAARLGDTAEARRLLTRATQRNPSDIEAWLGLASVVDSLIDKRECFQQILAVDPNHQEAQTALEQVEKRIAASRPPTSEPNTCYRHPEVETSLRCNRCNKPICPKCAVRTPVGFRCPECIREQEDKYYTGPSSDYLIAAVVSLPLGVVGVALFSMVLSMIWLFFGLILSFMLAPAVAGGIAESVRWAVKRRRSRYLGHVATSGLVVPALLLILFYLSVGAYFAMIYPGVLIMVGAPVVMARLR